jgi:hypothetical protein
MIAGDDFDPLPEQLQRDCDTFRQIAEGLNRLEAAVNEGRDRFAARDRGYFTPDEDDRIRQLLLAYRNYRLACYEIIFRYIRYRSMRDPTRQLRALTLGLAVAVTLFARSLKFIQLCEHHSMLRRKLNEPDEKYDLAPGFFDEVLSHYSSLGNYRLLLQANWDYSRHRRLIRQLQIEASPDWRWLAAVIRRQRKTIANRLAHVLVTRLRYDWRAFWQTTFRPVRRARYSIQAQLGDALADARTTTHYVPALDETVLTSLHPLLQPGDVLLVRAEQKFTTSILPGFWAHAAIYFGGRSDLEAMALCAHPHLQKHDQEIPAAAGRFGHVLEAISPRVQINPLEKCLRADHVCVLRPVLSAEEKRAALAEAFGHLGKPYDFEFDFNVSTRVVCTELVYRSYHRRGRIEFPLVKRLGRFTLSGDDLMNLALDGLAAGDAAPWRIAALVLKRRDGRAHFIPPDRAPAVLRRIREGWRPAAKALAPGAAPPDSHA